MNKPNKNGFTKVNGPFEKEPEPCKAWDSSQIPEEKSSVCFNCGWTKRNHGETNVGTCKTCQWWYNGTCEAIDHPQQPETLWEIKITVADDHNLDWKLKTGPDFGCVHHLPKDQQNAISIET